MWTLTLNLKSRHQSSKSNIMSSVRRISKLMKKPRSNDHLLKSSPHQSQTIGVKSDQDCTFCLPHETLFEEGLSRELIACSSGDLENLNKIMFLYRHTAVWMGCRLALRKTELSKWRWEWIDLHSSACWTPDESAPFVEKAIFFPLDGFSSFVKDQVTIGVWVHFWVFNPIPLIRLPVTVPIPCSF